MRPTDTNLTETPYSHIWPLLWTHMINYLFLFFGIYLTFLCITVVYIHLLCLLFCHKLFKAHIYVFILSYASLHLPIAGIQEKHDWIYEWLRNKKKEGRRKTTRKGEREKRKISELRKLLWVPTSCFCFLMYITNWPWCWERSRAGGEGDDRGWDGWMASPTQWTWVWVDSGSWWWTGRPGVLRFMGSQRVGHDWATELNWTNWPLETQTYRYTFKENYSREKGLQKFITQAYETKSKWWPSGKSEGQMPSSFICCTNGSRVPTAAHASAVS